MKKIKYILSAILLSGSLFSCTDDWNSHYQHQEGEVNNDNISIVNATAAEYLKSNQNFSSMYNLFEEAGIIKTMNEREQLFTLLVVNNSSVNNASTDDNIYLAKSHITDVALSPNKLADGQRVFMWNGKYLNVKVEKKENNEEDFYFNGTKVKKIIKVSNGYIYELESYVSSPKSMYEIIQDLDEDYSMFQNMILSRNQKVFDKTSSLPIGVDNTGSTVYDSIFIVTNPYFSAKGFDIMSESLTATMLIPSNEVIEKALNVAHKSLNDWKLTRVDSILENWVFQSAFFNKQYKKEDFTNNVDLTSIFSKQWRTTVQDVDLDQPIQMSNGVAYYIKSMKIPTNVLIYRLKDYMKWYEFLSEDDKNIYFASENLIYDSTNTDVAGWSGWPAGGFPLIENRVVLFKLADSTIPKYTMNFVPFQYKTNLGGTYTATPYLIPPGEYDLSLGFKQNMGQDVEISFNNVFIQKLTISDLTSTTFHYDRSGNGFPEGYDTSKATDKNKTKYDCDGGKIGTITITGTQPVPVTITFHSQNPNGKKLILHHWCLRPTKNCY